MQILIIVIVFLALMTIYGSFLTGIGYKKLNLTRSFAKHTVYAGTEFEMIETVENDHLLIVPWLRVETRMTSALQFGKLENLSIRSEMYHRSLFSLMPYQKIIRRHRVRACRRGIYHVGHAAMTFGDITGLFRKTIELENEAMSLVVYPKLVQEDRIPQAVLQRIGEWSSARSMLYDPFMIRGIRDYLPGDSIRDIHWNATAKSQSLQVKVHEWNLIPRLLVVLNGQTREDQWGELMDYEQEIVERVISLAASCCIFAMRHGLETGFAANMPFGDAEGENAVFPLSKPGNEENILYGFSRLVVKRTKRFPTFLNEIDLPNDCYVLIVSSYNSPEMQALCSELSTRGIQVSLCIADGECA